MKESKSASQDYSRACSPVVYQSQGSSQPPTSPVTPVNEKLHTLHGPEMEGVGAALCSPDCDKEISQGDLNAKLLR